MIGKPEQDTRDVVGDGHRVDVHGYRESGPTTYRPATTWPTTNVCAYAVVDQKKKKKHHPNKDPKIQEGSSSSSGQFGVYEVTQCGKMRSIFSEKNSHERWLSQQQVNLTKGGERVYDDVPDADGNADTQSKDEFKVQSNLQANVEGLTYADLEFSIDPKRKPKPGNGRQKPRSKASPVTPTDESVTYAHVDFGAMKTVPSQQKSLGK
ncbi:uncharacterized protein [Ptychodera flava]|uniref:uncharacterized protein n=1 Tax=Ptychodera flava TaxID=63121 RepID=UPI00396A5622